MYEEHRTESDESEHLDVADVLIEELQWLGVEVIFLNPGTDTAPIQEAVARALRSGKEVPRVVLCPHEAIAMSAAHAYYAVTGRPQVVMVHVDVGTQNLGSMMHNAYRGEAGVVVIAGRTPMTAYGELTGGRDHFVHWQQDVSDQPGIVRAYAKAVFDLERAETLSSQLSRAFQLAVAPVSGPVYVTVNRELLMERMPANRFRPDIRRRHQAAPPGPDADALRTVAQILATSQRPVIVTSRSGRDPYTIAPLIQLAELLGATVIDKRERMNFPSDHPNYLRLRQECNDAMEKADVVVLIDCIVPWVPLLCAPSENAKIVSIDADPLKPSVPGWSFPVDVSLQCSPLSGIQTLSAELSRLEVDEPSSLWRKRRDRLNTHPVPPAILKDEQITVSPLSTESVARSLTNLLAPEDIVVEESTTNADAVRAHLSRTIPATHFHPGGSGLGWALGAAIGVKLTGTTKRVVAIVGDGSFMFSSPLAALWTALNSRAPFLTVVLQNGGYAASRRPVFDLFPEGASTERGDVVGTRFAQAPNFELVAQACGAFGATVTCPEELLPLLERSLKEIDAGRSAVVAVQVASPWFDERSEPWPT